MRVSICCLSAAGLLATALACAQEAPTASAPDVAPAAIATTPAAPVATPAPTAGPVVELEIAEAISSKTRQRGQRFALRLHAPLLVDGVVVLPAGTPGQGEIVHADRARGGGKPGELLLAARYLEHDGVRIPLRGMKLGASGKDRTVASVNASIVLGPFAQFIHGGEIEIPAGTIANAKLAGALPSPVPGASAVATTAEAIAPDAGIDPGTDATVPMSAPSASAPPAPAATPILTPHQD